MTIQQFLLILRARWKAALITLLVTVLVAAAITVIMPRRYTATAAVIIDVKSPDPLAGIVLPGMVAPGYMSTQVDVINSDRVALRAVKLLGLDRDPAAHEEWVKETGGQGSFPTWLSNKVQINLDVRPSRDSNVITIDYKAPTPEFSAAAANAFTQAYIDINLELKVEPARQYAQWFEGQAKISRDKLDKAQKALYDYQQKAGIVATDERLDVETSQLNTLTTQLATVQSQTTDSQSKRNAGAFETMPEVVQNPLIASLKTQIATVDAKLQESNGNLGANHPQTLRTQAELASLKGQLARETANIAGSIDTAYRASRQRERELKTAIDTQKAKVLDANSQRNELNVLKGDADAAQREFEAVTARASQTRLESLSNQTNAVALSSATPPTDPSRPRVLLNMLASVFVGTLLGVCVALIKELSNRRVRSAQDLVETLDLPVLASIATDLPASQTRRLPSKPFRAALPNGSPA